MSSTCTPRHPRFTEVVGPTVEFERIAGGCLFAEGPVWHPTGTDQLTSEATGGPLRRSPRAARAARPARGRPWHPPGQYLLGSDMPGDHLRRWSATDGVTTFRKPCNKSNGLTWDRQGRLLACEHASSQVSRTEPDGRITPLATHYQGKQLNSPNDIVCAADGGIYFSDPPYGRAEFYGVKRPQELPFQGVFRVGPDPKSPVLLADDFGPPHG